MIEIKLSDMTYELDVCTLIKDFYPNEIIKVFREGKERKSENGRISGPQNENPPLEVNENYQTIDISFMEGEIQITFSFEGNDKTQGLIIDPGLPKPLYKNAMKRFLYRTLAELTGKVLPWGILTGIRPTKLIYEMLDQGDEHSIIIDRMKEEYLCSEAKINTSIRIAERELDLLREIDYQNGYSLYVGIPFCPSTCLYCSFTSYSIVKYSELVDAYLNALEKEIIYAATCFPNKKLTTVYFGGGTPTTLSAEQLDYLIGLLKSKFDFTYVKEFCVEAGRPDSITREKLEVLKKWGVDRISINPQSMQQKTLDLIGRQHTTEAVVKAFHLARETGHDNINMDIIIGLPGEQPEDVADTLLQIEALNPESLTVHTLALKRAARLNTQKENYDTLRASGVPKMQEQTIQFAKKHSYLPYYLYRQKNMADNLENIGYSRYGKEGLYNILIMEEKQTILALGAGGMSKFVFYEENRIERVDNVKSVTDYISRIDEMILRKQDFISKNGSIQ